MTTTCRSLVSCPAGPARPGGELRTGKLKNSRPIRRLRAPISLVIPMRYRQIPCYPQERKSLRDFNALQANSLFFAEQGFFLREQGIFSKEQGIFCGNREFIQQSPARTAPQAPKRRHKHGS